MKLKLLLTILTSGFLLYQSVPCQTVGSGKRSGTARANGISIAYESFGRDHDPAILLIQGTGAQLTAWPEEFCWQLARAGYRVIRFDNRDAGLSSQLDSLGTPDWAKIFPMIGQCEVPALPYTLLDMAKDAVGLMDTLKIRRAHVVGISMGGAIAQLLAIHFPERIISLTCMMSSSGNPDAVPGNARVLQIMATPPPETDNRDTLARYLFRIYKAIGSPRYPTPDSLLMQMAWENIGRAWHPAGSLR